MKKTVAIIMAALLLVSLCACGREVEVVAQETPAAQPSATEVPAVLPAATPADNTAELQALNALLTDITDSVRPGSSGCSLRSVICGAKLLDWCSSTTMTADQLTAAVVEWRSGQEEDVQSLFAESLLSVSDACYALSLDNADELLDTAGCTDAGYPWSDQAFSAAQAIFDAA